MSHQLIAKEEISKVPLNDITPPMRFCEVELNLVGVRKLLPYNNTAIVAPYVEVDVGDRSATEKVGTQGGLSSCLLHLTYPSPLTYGYGPSPPTPF